MMVISFCGRRLIQKQNNLFKIPKRNGYIVLVPEIGEDLPQKNPLLKEDNLPEFNNITIEKCIAAIGKQTLEFEEQVNSIEANLEKNPNADVFNDALHPIEESYIPLEITWGVAKTLFFGNQSLMPTKCYFSIHERARKAHAHKYNHKLIFEACKKAKNNEKLGLSQEQSRVLSKYILEGKLNGLELNAKDAKYLDTILRELHPKLQDFKDRLGWVTKQFSYTVRDKEVMRECPESYLKTIAVDPNQPHEGPWIINLQPYIAKPFLEYCPDRHLRHRIWETDVSRGSIFNEKLLSTSIPLEEIRAARQKKAKVLGFASYADMSMETKMARSLNNLYYVFDTLLETAYPAQEKEIQQMSEFAIENGGEGNILPWDVAYWNRKQIQTLYKYDEEVLKNYFPLPRVLTGIFQLLSNLFSIKIVENRKVDVWHEDVRFFDVFDLKKTDSEPVAGFYLDAYARRDEKVRFQQDAGWMVPIKNRSKVCNTTPLAALIFNFSPPIFGKPSLLTFREVKILFQKFGHLLQNLLTTVEYGEISGLSFVEWDAAQISDFFMENWLYEPSTIEMISSHYDTNEPLPTEMVDNLNLVKKHLAGYKLCKELYFSRLDLELYASDKFWQMIMNDLWKKHFVIPQQKRDCHVCSFDAIFTGDWSAAYYSQLWSELVAADAFSSFKEMPNDQKHEDKLREIGSRYRETFLSLGGSYPANEIFRRFRGRDPNAEALLENLGLNKYAQKPLTE